MLGSDHTPLIFDTREDALPPKSNRFFFETGWLEVTGFKDLLFQVWSTLFDHRSGCRDPIDIWNFLSAGARRHLTAWGANQGRDTRVRKAQLLSQIQELDRRADSSGLQENEWALRYHLEDQLLNIVKIEEEYWRQRGRCN